MAASKELVEKVNQLFNATKDLQSLEDMQPHINAFREYLEAKNYATSTLGSKLSAAGLYKAFKSLELIQGKNAESVAKHDANGNVAGYELKHYVVVACGLSKEQWTERNISDKVTERLENSTEIDPETYLEVTEQLLESNEPDEVAVGLIAATGRRPVEITARGKFKAIEGKNYHLLFEGQAKKRGEKPVFEIACLFPADYIIQRLNWFRKQPEIKELISDVMSKHRSDSEQNAAFENRQGNPYRRIVKEFFGGKLETRKNQDSNDCKGLRAAYLAIATERDCQGSIGQKMLHAAKLAGHYISETKINDRELNNLITTLGYSDYFTTKPVSFPSIPVKKDERRANVKAHPQDLERIKDIQKDLGLKKQEDVIRMLLENYELKALRIKQSEVVEPVKVVETVEPVEAVEPVETAEQVDQVEVVEAVEPVETVENLSYEQLQKKKSPEVFEERMLRAFTAVCEWNSEQPSQSTRVAVTNSVFRELAGGHPNNIKAWMENHKDEIISHNTRYGIAGKDPQNLVTYHNKSLGTDFYSLLSKIKVEKLGVKSTAHLANL